MRYRVGVDLGGTYVKIGLVDETYRILTHSMIPTHTERTPEEILTAIATEVLRLLAQENIPHTEVEGVGIGSPGVIESKTGTVIYSNNFSWENVPVHSMLEKILSLPVRIANDAQCAALGEAVAGTGKGCKNLILITLGTGVGSGIVLNGRIFDGANPGGGVAGHMVIHRGGELCSCGKRGCLEAYASATALIRDMKRVVQKQQESPLGKKWFHRQEEIEAKTAFDEAAEGDGLAQELIAHYEEALADGIANLIDIFRPDKVLLGGGVSNQGTALTDTINELLKTRCFGGDLLDIPPVAPAFLGNKAGMIGAAALCETEKE